MIFTSPVSARSNPLISCICVTKRNLEEIKGSVGCFMAQTYENRELIVLHDGGNREVEEFILAANSCSPDINLFYYECHSDKGMSLGELRNKSMELCSGDYVCQWDDDDWMHRDRILRQFDAMMGNFQPACVLTNLLIYDRQKREAYLSEFRLWEGSIIFDRKIVTDRVEYPKLGRGEDSVFFNNFLNYGYYPLVASNLYIYVVHGSNTWPTQHFDGMKSRSRKLSDRGLSVIDEIISGRLPVSEGSEILDSSEFLSSIRYSIPTNLANRKLSEYISGIGL